MFINLFYNFYPASSTRLPIYPVIYEIVHFMRRKPLRLQLGLGSSHHGLGHDSPLNLTSRRLGHHLGKVDLHTISICVSIPFNRSKLTFLGTLNLAERSSTQALSS